MAEDILPEVELVWNAEAFMARNDNLDNSIAALRPRAKEKNLSALLRTEWLGDVWGKEGK